MVRFLLGLAVAALVTSGMASAQQDEEVVWVQIEARPSLSDALVRAQDYALTLEDVHGFALGGGWYAVVLGPYRPTDASQVLDVFRADGLIPRDSYITSANTLGTQFFPIGQDLLRSRTRTEPVSPSVSSTERQTQTLAALPEATRPEEPEAEMAAENAASPEPAASDITAEPRSALPPLPVGPSSQLAALEAAARADTESDRDARRAEQALSLDAKRGLQEALQWAGFYRSTIDGAFGRGTRGAMSDWQRANGFAVTGVLSSAQRALLIGQYTDVLAGLGLDTYRDTSAGLELQAPLGLVAFDRYEPPFIHFAALSGAPVQLLLISQPGDRGTLESLYTVMQTLEIVPLEGPRSIDNDSFSLIGRNSMIVSETRVRLADGALKGFTLVWPVGDEERRTRLVKEIQRSLTRLDGVLDPAAGAGSVQQVDFVSGLALRKPRLSRSGFFVDPRGAVVTTAEAVQGCGRILLDDVHEARLSAIDPERGLAILTPDATLAPPYVAEISSTPPRLQSDIAVAGYSYEGVLGAPSMTFGTLADVQGLRGEREINRLQLASLPGDAGGPVIDGSGHVMGMLLPRGAGERRLPDDVRFALTGPAIAEAMRNAGITLTPAQEAPQLAPEDISLRAIDMTVLVSCWE